MTQFVNQCDKKAQHQGQKKPSVRPRLTQANHPQIATPPRSQITDHSNRLGGLVQQAAGAVTRILGHGSLAGRNF
jgi:hypothetical protein